MASRNVVRHYDNRYVAERLTATIADDDIFIIAGNSADYTVTQVNADRWTVTEKSSGRTDTLTYFDAIQFNDRLVDIENYNRGGNEITGTNGNDYLVGTDGNDIIKGGNGNDVMVGGKGNDYIDGEGGSYNQVDFLGSISDYTFTRNSDGSIKVTSSEYGTDTLKNIHGAWFVGSSQWKSINDLLSSGGGGQNEIIGTSGNDYLVGTDGNDIIRGGDGIDVMVGGKGNDYIDGEGGSYNQVDFLGSISDYTFSRNSDGSIKVTSSEYGTDTLKNIHGAWFVGSSQWKSINDLLSSGGGGQNEIIGTSGNDYLVGTTGDDVIKGRDGNDVMVGGKGNDYIDGEGGSYNQVDFLGSISDYTFTRNNDGSVKVTSSEYGTDTLKNIDGAWFVGSNQWKSMSDLLSSGGGGGGGGHNRDPYAKDDTAYTEKDQSVNIDVLRNDSDPDGDSLTVKEVTNGNNGTVRINFDGTVKYTPDAGFYGRDSFKYSVSDGKGGWDEAYVHVDVKKPPAKDIHAKIVGDSYIKEGNKGDYKVQLDYAVSEDTWFTIRANDGSANRIDRNDYEANNQDIIYGGFYTLFKGHTLHRIYDRVPNGHAFREQQNDRAAIGPNGKPFWDFVVLKDGVVQQGGLIHVKVKAGETMSESFDVKAFKEKITVDVSDNPTGNSFRKEGNEYFNLKITDVKTSGYDKIKVDPNFHVTIHDWDMTRITPVALDLNGDGEIGVTGETSSFFKDPDAELGRTVEFDMDGDGDMETIEWFDGSGDGILVDNRDGMAAEDMNGTRLFGDQGGKFANGYEQMAGLDLNNDGKLSGVELEGLELWVDDGDAIVEDGELQSLAEHGIAELSVEMTLVEDEDGRALMRSTATTEDGRVIMTEDVWFASAEEAKAALDERSAEEDEMAMEMQPDEDMCSV